VFSEDAKPAERLLQIELNSGTQMLKLIPLSLVLFAVTVSLPAVGARQTQKRKNFNQPAQQARQENIETGPEVLSYNELIELYQQDVPDQPLRNKLNRLLTTPFVSNRASTSGVLPLKPSSPHLGKFLRVAEWNVERGLEFDAIELAFTDPSGLAGLMDQKGSKATADEHRRILEQVQLLKQADVLVLNEVDWGVNRTLFRNVAADLAQGLGMNYAYGVEFVEVDPITMGIDQQAILREIEQAYSEPHESKNELIEHVRRIMTPDPKRYRGLHGTAILSRFPLLNVRLIPFKFQGHDWYADEKKKASATAKAEEKLSIDIFKEQLVRQVRRGGRMMLLADIADPELPTGRVTIVATHLEDRTTPAKRRTQLNEVLDEIKSIKNPVIFAGDMNTSTHNAAPVSFTRAIKQRLGSGKWWAEDAAPTVIASASPFGWAYNISHRLIGFARGVDDPTVRSIPVVGKNPEAAFFKSLETYRFLDGSAFDFRGEQDRTSNGRSGNLADSNERSEKGFAPTSELGRTYGPVGKYKLDWIFVRPASLTDPHDKTQSFRFAPHYGRTLKDLNQSIPDRISDHSPIIVDLPLQEPSLTVSLLQH
jgi:endonuclease/exonuclease/phosphatase family metal-dependent hydrolase